MSRPLRRHHDKRLKAKARYRAMNGLQWYGEFTARDAGIYWSRADSYDDYEYSDNYEDEDPWDTGHYAVPDYDLYWAY